MTYTQKISKFRGSEGRIGLSGYVKVSVVLLIYKLKYIVVFDYLSYILCYMHNGDASTQDDYPTFIFSVCSHFMTMNKSGSKWSALNNLPFVSN